MVEVDIPGFGRLTLEYLVLDYNGTLACDGILLPGAKESLQALAECLTIHVVTADTFGGAAEGLCGVPCTLTVLPPGDQAEAKADHLKALGAARSAAVGNGRNDGLLLKAAALGIAVVQEEGASAETVLAAQVVCRDIRDALALLRDTRRLVATLRS